MEKRILRYRHYMDELLSDIESNHNKSKEELETLRAEHLVQVSFFQHERLIHLIVTVLFALLEVISLVMVMMSPELFTLLLTVTVLILLLPYIRHYYILENEVQKMYKQYDKLSHEIWGTGFDADKESR
ncbi:MAG: hypothetical protein ACI4EX_00800 [Lachnospiraceae bacterium]